MPISTFGYEVDCEWSEWSSPTSCTKTCGTGSLLQTRTVLTHEQNGGSKCTGENIREKDCNTDDCPPGNYFKTLHYQIIRL